MQIDKDVLQREFQAFNKSIIELSDRPFENFHVGLPEEWEGYKLRLREDALEQLSVSQWTEDLIGTGQILQYVINAIELKLNNLFIWDSARYGDKSRPHHILHEPGSNAKALEKWFYEYYVGNSDSALAFDRFIQLAKRNYSLIAYLYFLKDETQFMPIMTGAFEKAFSRLGVEMKLASECSWNNYSTYNEVLMAIREGLETYCDVKAPRLIDAHSFCWMLVDMEREILKLKESKLKTKMSPTAESRKASKVVDVTDLWARATIGMTNSAMDAVAQSGKPIAETTRKMKTCSMGKAKLEKYISALVKAQNNRCALSGIEFDVDGNSGDTQLYPSLDRIDSSIGYEEGNMQVVCRFLNFWKSNEDDVEFRRLMKMLVDRYSYT